MCQTRTSPVAAYYANLFKSRLLCSDEVIEPTARDERGRETLGRLAA